MIERIRERVFAGLAGCWTPAPRSNGWIADHGAAAAAGALTQLSGQEGHLP